ncbi:MAG: arsenate reductase (glutaredoxin) [Pseudomonadota bacterium]
MSRAGGINVAVKMYHNPKCSKSRETLALLEERGITPELILYLETPPSASELAELLKMLGLEPRELMRSKEAVYRDRGLADEALARNDLIDAMVEHPILIERPIVINDGRAALGRPPANVLDIL